MQNPKGVLVVIKNEESFMIQAQNEYCALLNLVQKYVNDGIELYEQNIIVIDFDKFICEYLENFDDFYYVKKVEFDHHGNVLTDLTDFSQFDKIRKMELIYVWKKFLSNICQEVQQFFDFSTIL